MRATHLCLLAAIMATTACHDDKGPRPDIISVSPETICTGCGDSTLVITGTNLSSAVKDALVESPSVALPEVTLISPDGEATAVPTDGSSLTTTDGEQTLTVVVPRNLVPPTLEGEPEILYDLKVKNPSGRARTVEGAVLVVPPNNLGLTGIDPPFGWNEVRTNVTITCDGWFISTPTAFITMNGTADADPVMLDNVAFIDENTITAVVPAGAPVGIYDVTVTNPGDDGAYGMLPGGFAVVSQPVPSIFTVVPSRGTTQDDTQVSIFGENFRDPVRVELINQDGEAAVSIEDATFVSDGQIDAVFPTKTQSGDLPTGPYLVRVINTDEETYSTYSAFLVTNPAGNLNVFEESSIMLTGRRMLAGVFGNDVLGNRYVYAIGGDTGDDGEVLDTIELSQLSMFGDLGPWKEQASRLNVPRVGAAAVTVPVFDDSVSQYVPVRTYIYVIGGLSDDGEVLSSLERAVILSPDDAPVITDVATSAGAGALAEGTWYYKVAAVLPGADPDNPGGETLASDEVVASLAADGSITLSWEPAQTDGDLPTGYRVYRTDEPDGVSQSEHMIAQVTGTTFVDDGVDAGDQPARFPGSTGDFQLVEDALGTGRWGHGAALLHDDSDEGLIFVLGGKDAPAGGVVGTSEWVSVDVDGQISVFSDAGTTGMTDPRAFFATVVEHAGNVSGYPGEGSRLWVMGGIGTDGTTLDTLEESDVSTGGGNGAWTVNDKKVQSAAGVMSVITNEKLFCLGGAADADDTTFGSVTPNGRDTEFDEDGNITGSINSTASSLIEPRALGIGLQGAGFIYFIGGTSDGTDAVATTERTF